MKKTIKVFFSMILLSLLLASCSETEQNTEADANTPTTPDETVSSPAAEETDEQQAALASLEDADFEGHVFSMISRIVDNPEWIIWQNRDIIAEEMTGETINDAVFERNEYVMDRFDCGITEYKSYDASTDVKKSHNAGDNAYDVALPAMAYSLELATDGFLYDLNQIDELSLSSPWWDQNANASLSLVNKLYFTSGDMLILNNDSTGAFVFNKELVSSWNLENPYELVREGKWTFDVFHKQIETLGQDLNNDGKMNGQDQFGFMNYVDILNDMYHAGGLDYCAKDSDDLPYAIHNTEHAYDVLNKMFDIVNNKNTYLLHKSYGEHGGNAFIWGESIFQADRVFYYWLRLRDIEALRGMETDFGIIPVPKWDEAQENYRATVNYSTSCSITIPLCTYSVENTAVFLNALNCKSKYTLQPAYYDITLTGKYPRDVESSEMLDLIFANRVFDIGMFGSIGKIANTVHTLADTDSRNFASAFKSSEKIFDRELSRLVKAYEELEY
ncbi:MAG: hypothetical protein IJC71_00860 [Clostridia bacterium]|nr:hypothetical protein [Clostridia bacterium]